jgi:hypothetical protein
MSGRFSRDKGARGEREAAITLSEALDLEVERAARNGISTFDLDCDALAAYAIEVKFLYEKPDTEAWWKQAIEQSKGRVPMLMYRMKRGKWRVRLPMQHLLGHNNWGHNPWIEVNVDGFAQLWQSQNGC